VPSWIVRSRPHVFRTQKKAGHVYPQPDKQETKIACVDGDGFAVGSLLNDDLLDDDGLFDDHRINHCWCWAICVIIIQTAEPVPAKDAPKPSIWGGTLKLAAHGPPAHFDFYASNTIANIGSQAAMYNKLVRKIGVSADLPITGDLAHSWEIAGDAKTYTFFLRDGVKFHDGSDFSARRANSLVEGRPTSERSPLSTYWTRSRLSSNWTQRVDPVGC